MYKEIRQSSILVPVRPSMRSLLSASTKAVYGNPMNESELRQREIEETYSAMTLLGMCTGFATDFVVAADSFPGLRPSMRRFIKYVRVAKNRSDLEVYSSSTRYGYHFMEYLDNVVDKFTEYCKKECDELKSALDEFFKDSAFPPTTALYVALYVSEIAVQVHNAANRMFDFRLGRGCVRIACDPFGIYNALEGTEREVRSAYKLKDPTEHVRGILERISAKMADKNLVMQAEKEVRPDLRECSVCHDLFPPSEFPLDGDKCMTCTGILQKMEANRKKKQQASKDGK